jgi:hypothetical protein
MKHVTAILAAALIAALSPAMAGAQSVAPAPMSERELSKFIQDWPAVVQWLEAKGKQFDADAPGAAMAALFMGADFEAFLKGKGWTSERFSYVVGTATALLGYVYMERQNPELMKEFDQAIAQINATAGMSAADKAQAVKSLEEAKKAMLALPAEAKLNEAELKLVRARYDALVKLFDAD